MFSFTRRYRGPVQAVILDWAGTTVDFGCLVPATVFTRIFDAAGVPVTMVEVRAFMGRDKRDHIAGMLAQDAIRARWRERHGREPGDTDVERLFADFVPQQLAALKENCEVIPGVQEGVAALRSRGIRVGSTSGYTGEMMAICRDAAARQGYAPDCVVTVSDVPQGRPSPFMAWRAAIEMGVYPPEACVKVGDAVSDIDEGLNAGMWTVGCAVTGNEIGLSRAEWATLEPAEKDRARLAARDSLAASGAHDVVDGVIDLIPAIDAIERRLAAGERP